MDTVILTLQGINTNEAQEGAERHAVPGRTGLILVALLLVNTVVASSVRPETPQRQIRECVMTPRNAIVRFMPRSIVSCLLLGEKCERYCRQIRPRGAEVVSYCRGPRSLPQREARDRARRGCPCQAHLPSRGSCTSSGSTQRPFPSLDHLNEQDPSVSASFFVWIRVEWAMNAQCKQSRGKARFSDQV